MARKLSIDVSADVEVIPAQYRNGTALSEVKKVSPSALQANRKNKEYFVEETEDYFNNLREDIRRRGIIVPLIAKQDGTLLAGHNRLQVAVELNLAQVPVQYVQEDLGDEREREFIIKDNLFRRQLAADEWIMLYRKLYPDFDAVFLNDTTKAQRGRLKAGDNRLTITAIAEETGQKYDTVKTQIRRAREATKHKKTNASSQQSKKRFSEPISDTDTSSQKQVDKTIRSAMKNIMDLFESASAPVQTEIKKKMRRLIQ